MITLTLQETGEELNILTGSQGRFIFDDLPPGIYDLAAERQGFPGLLVRDIEVVAGQRYNVDLEMQIEDPPTPDRRVRRRPDREPPRTAVPQPEITVTTLPSVVTDPRPERLERAEIPFEAEILSPEFGPIGFAGRVTSRSRVPATEDFIPIADRWRIGLAEWDRYAPYIERGDFPYVRGRGLDPYNQSVLKGDYPIFGNRWFMVATATSDTITEYRRLPVVGPPSAALPATPDFFSKGDQFQVIENVIVSVDLFRGYSAFKPFDVRFKVTPVFNGNYLSVRETGAVNIDVRRGTDRIDSHIALQEAFAEVRLAEISPYFDFISLRAGTQFFNSDFRGFIFFDNQPGIRLFGNLKANKHQYNLVYFHMLEKDTNSLLNTFESRQQEVVIANYYIQDSIKLGYTTQFSVHYNHDKPSFRIDRNRFLVRPAPIANPVLKSVNAIYFGWAGDGHFGVLNINHAFYQVIGQEKPSQIAGDVFGPKDTDINAQMVALELSIDRDWKRYRTSFFYASGDDNIGDGRARGFDTIVDNVNFAGGSISLFNRQGIRLAGTGVGLNQRFSFIPTLRSAKEQGQANFVNPGLYLLNAGFDAELTPKLRYSANVNVMAFSHTDVLEALLFQSNIRRFLGVDVGMGAMWRPWLNDNFILNGGVAVFIPGKGFRDIYSSKSLISTFLELRMTF